MCVSMEKVRLGRLGRKWVSVVAVTKVYQRACLFRLTLSAGRIFESRQFKIKI